ncbi:MAG: hypothetical protein EOO08_09080 [Chitinophagaceae bacterium]|nr:MAG: hypothetical protein EOO08_09080 [Chitinophagaceae bacterium]
MSNSPIATVQTRIAAAPARVWQALTDPASIRAYMFGAEVHTDWQPGSAITWKGEWKGKPYEDKGRIVEATPEKKLTYTHFSPLTGEEDLPENYHTVTIILQPDGAGTLLTLTQDGNATDEARAHSESNWKAMLEGLRTVAEQ